MAGAKTGISGLGAAMFVGTLALGAAILVPPFLKDGGEDDFVKVTLTATWNVGGAHIGWTDGRNAPQTDRADALTWRRTVNARHGDTVRIQVLPDTPTPNTCQVRGTGVNAQPVNAQPVKAGQGGTALCVRLVP